MGFCSGSQIFDDVINRVAKMDIANVDKELIVHALVDALWYHDWDCEFDVDALKYDFVERAYKKLMPEYFTEDNFDD